MAQIKKDFLFTLKLHISINNHQLSSLTIMSHFLGIETKVSINELAFLNAESTVHSAIVHSAFVYTVCSPLTVT